MKSIVIRDDDVSYFTQPDTLSTLYAPLIERGLSVALSVIPDIACDVSLGPLNGRFFHQHQIDHSPFIPPEFRGNSGSFPVSGNLELMEFLKNTPQFEILQHGFRHTLHEGLPEGANRDKMQVEENLNASQKILLEGFGYAPDFFVPPWDTVSKQALEVLAGHFKGVSIDRVGKRHVPWYLKPKAVYRKLKPGHPPVPYFRVGDLTLFEYPGTILSMFNDSASIPEQIESHLKSSDILILVTHHWEYFFDWDKPNQRFIDGWHTALERLLSNPEIEFLSFAELNKRLFYAG